MEEFKVNEYITLKLEYGKTNIYVGGDLFNQCKYMLIRKTVYELEDLLEDIDSVDELAEHLDRSLEGVEPELIDIPAETQFWVHKSNMQVWAENNYNTKLIHTNLAYPLLKKLAEKEDKIAKNVLIKAIIKEFTKKKYRKIKYLLEQDYLNTKLFTYEEINLLFNEFMENINLNNAEVIELFLDISEQWSCYKIKQIIPKIKQVLKTQNINKITLKNSENLLEGNYFIDNRYINLKQLLGK